MKFLKENYIVVIALGLPLLFVVIVALGVSLSAGSVKTDYDFVYATCYDSRTQFTYGCGDYITETYSVSSHSLERNALEERLVVTRGGLEVKEDISYKVRFFLHNTKINESREVPFEMVQGLMLNDLLTSPDGVTISSSYESGPNVFLIFDGGRDYGWYLTEGAKKKKLQLINTDDRYYYRDNFYFIGWVL